MHIGFIMDGNRRWAKENKIPIQLQHEKWAENLKNIIEICTKKEIPTISFWALAYKNIMERSDVELKALYKLLDREISTLEDSLLEKNVRFYTVGEVELLPEKSQKILSDLEKKTKNNTGMQCIIALGYGGQREIIRGVKACIKAGVNPDSLNEEEFWKYLDTGRFSNPDLIIRTGCKNRLRHSGYFLYNSEYSEYYFTNTYWPDMDASELDKALDKLHTSERNFGK